MSNIKGYLFSEDSNMVQPQIVSDKNDITIFKTILQEGDRENRNNRIYKTSTIKNAINSAYVQERLKTKSWYGECGHPLDQDIKRQLYIDQTRISHIITDVEFQGNLLYGLVECAQTQAGRDMQGLIRQKSEVAFSMRGFGPVTKQRNGKVYIEDPLNILTYDWVIHPSHDKAYMTNIIQEDASINSSNGNKIIPLTEDAILAYINSESSNVKDLTNQLNILGEKKSYNEGKLYIQEGKDMLVVFLEDYITKDIDNYLSNL